MSRKEHPPGVHEAFLVKRHLRLQDTPAQAMDEARTRLMELRGMDEAKADPRGGKMHLAYDASVLHLDRVIEVLEESGCRPHPGRWQRFRRNWYRSTDSNVAENARQKPWSCH